MTAHRCRICRLPHYDPVNQISYPNPELLAQCEPLILPLLEAAREFESFGPGTPVEFVQWLAIDVRRAVNVEYGARKEFVGGPR